MLSVFLVGCWLDFAIAIVRLISIIHYDIILSIASILSLYNWRILVIFDLVFSCLCVFVCCWFILVCQMYLKYLAT